MSFSSNGISFPFENRMEGEVKVLNPLDASVRCKIYVKYRKLVTFNNDRTVKNEKGKMNIAITH